MHAGARLQREVERQDEGHGAPARGAHGIPRQVPPVSVRQYLPQRTHHLWPQTRMICFPRGRHCGLSNGCVSCVAHAWHYISAADCTQPEQSFRPHLRDLWNVKLLIVRALSHGSPASAFQTLAHLPPWPLRSCATARGLKLQHGTLDVTVA